MSTAESVPDYVTRPSMEPSRLLRWKNYHRGEDCLLICNGPSLNQVDWSRMPPHLVRFGLNKIYLGAARFGFVPRYLCCVNEKVLRQSVQALNRLSAVKFVSNRLDQAWYPDHPLQYRMNTQQLPAEAGPFSRDICAYVEEGWTVTHAALQIIYYMGFTRVWIVGMDHRYCQAMPGEENAPAVIDGDDVDHFDRGYFGGGLEWDQPDLINSEQSYRVARAVFAEAGRNIVDCTIGGACDVFEKRRISDLYV